MRDDINQLTIKAYRLTLLFPKKEPLRFKIREIAGNILINITALEVLRAPEIVKPDGFEGKHERELFFILEKELAAMDSLLEISRWQNWVSFFDVLKLKEEYAIFNVKIRDESRKLEMAARGENRLVPVSELIGKKSNFNSETTDDHKKEKIKNLGIRKEKILSVLKEKGRAQVWEIGEIMPKVSKRTIRRDFAELLKQGIIKRIGERNNTYYQIVEVGQ